MDFDPDYAIRKYPSMKFLFHSVVGIGGQTKYYNIYSIDKAHFFAECHHFNRQRACEEDFELQKEGDEWKAGDSSHENEAQQIGEEIDRLYPSPDR